MLMFIVVPISYILWLGRTLNLWVRRILYGSRVATYVGHDERCQEIIDQIKKWNQAGRPKLLRTARPNWASMSTKLSSNKEDCQLIPMMHLNHILEIDPENMTITCEPGVNMGQLTSVLCPQNLALKLQVEMESITIGGLSLGFGIETNSYLAGLFQETVLEYKLVTSSGDVITATPEDNPELFYAIPWSHGSLGFLLSVKVKLRKITQYVKVTYIPTYTAKDMAQKVTKYSTQENSPYDFIEGTQYTKEKGVLQLTQFVEPPSTPEDKARVNGINFFWKPFYYKWVETFLEKGQDWEIVPIKHFYHRFSRSIFWELEGMIPFANHPIYRCLWGWLGAPEVSLLKLVQGPVVRKASVYAHVVQESIMPIRHLEEGFDKFDQWFGVYPLLVFPIRVYDRGDTSGFLTPLKSKNLMLPNKDYGIFVDIGAYGGKFLLICRVFLLERLHANSLQNS
jgi:Delta24-sterol reductase